LLAESKGTLLVCRTDTREPGARSGVGSSLRALALLGAGLIFDWILAVMLIKIDVRIAHGLNC
jgi:hypothetical protein